MTIACSILPDREMMIAGFNFLVGFACGLRLTLLAFILVMLVVLTGTAVALAFGEASFLSKLGQWALAALCLQAGYVGGVFVRSYVD